MTILCRLRAFMFVECWCSYCHFSRTLDAMIDDWNREQASMPSMANCRKEGPLR